MSFRTLRLWHPAIQIMDSGQWKCFSGSKRSKQRTQSSTPCDMRCDHYFSGIFPIITSSILSTFDSSNDCHLDPSRFLVFYCTVSYYQRNTSISPIPWQGSFSRANRDTVMHFRSFWLHAIIVTRSWQYSSTVWPWLESAIHFHVLHHFPKECQEGITHAELLVIVSDNSFL